MRRGFLYLVAIMDWYSRRVLSWRLSNTLEPFSCCEALEEALNRYDPPEIFNTDQGSQFTSAEFTGLLKEAGVRISMDGRGRWMDNIFIERLWRSLKYECVYLNAFETGSESRRGIGHWINLYNSQRPHSAHNGATPEPGKGCPCPAGSNQRLIRSGDPEERGELEKGFRSPGGPGSIQEVTGRQDALFPNQTQDLDT